MGSLQKVFSKDLPALSTDNKPNGSRKWHDDQEKVPRARYPILDKPPEISSIPCSSIKAADRLGARIQSGPRASSMRVFRSNLSSNNTAELVRPNDKLTQRPVVTPAPIDSVSEEDDQWTLKQPRKLQSMRYIQTTPDVQQGLMPAIDSYYTASANTPEEATPEPLGSSPNGEVVISKTYVLREKEVASLKCGMCGKQLGVMIRGTYLGNGLSKSCPTCHPLPPPPSAWRCAETPTISNKKRGLIQSWRKVFHLEKLSLSHLVK